ncbi:membrane protein YfhO [Porphyromonas circumdentaria]|uniref:Membrane protein YfhO n=2 Tax=Porphyromonas circumdentaria TaxID=29524 RepID=A0A1T4PIX2_9PORP|nr:membrane protein YfhO [Porphyromonas circumdentaria]
MKTDTMNSNALLQRLKVLWPYAVIIVLFGIIATTYFMPATWEGRVLFQQDVAGASGNGQDVRDYEAATGEHSYWTNSLFGGMPMYQISPSYPSTEALSKAEKVYTLRWPLRLMGESPWLLFAMMIGFFLLLKSLQVRNIPATIGALMWTFSSYFIILIAAGHIWKLTALAFIPPTLAGLIWIYRKRWLQGAFVLAFFTALQLLANHVQMTYYFLFVMGAMVIGWFIEAIRTHHISDFLRSTGVALIAGLIGIAINSSNLYHTYRYAQETMRGGSELTLDAEDASLAQRAEKAQSGLDKEYITQWSYGVGETWSLLVPNIRGGASVPLGANPKQIEDVAPMYQQTIAGIPSYWGEQPFTSGPVYVGAFVCVLFLLGCFLVRGPIKWVMIAMTLLSILLSWGKNFMPLTNLFIDYFPLYNNFRAVSSILVIAELTIPLLAILGLVEVMKQPSILKEKKWATITAVGIPTVVLLLFIAVPDLFFSFLSSMEQEQLGQLILSNPEYIGLRDALVGVRRSMLRSDALHALIVILLSSGIVWLYTKGKVKQVPVLILLGVITLVDLWLVDKRYLYDAMYQRPAQVAAMAAPQTEADRTILQDKTLGYRVWNMSVNSFNDATTSRWHRSVGGYHAAKLQRYQDLITHQLLKGNEEVVNMLNTRYIIQPDPETGMPKAFFNDRAYGPAWFAQSIKVVSDANSEMKALNTEDLRTTAIVDARFVDDNLKRLAPLSDSTANVTLIKHTPNEVEYLTSVGQDALLVCSEIYYPEGWIATVNGKEVPIIRVNYTLRGVIVPAGTHSLRLTFAPTSIATTERIAFGALILLLLLLLGAIYSSCKKYLTTKTIK